METATENYGKQTTQNVLYLIPNHLYKFNIWLKYTYIVVYLAETKLIISECRQINRFYSDHLILGWFFIIPQFFSFGETLLSGETLKLLLQG